MNKVDVIVCVGLLMSVFSARAQDYPASPLEKEGYRLIFHDEFEGKEIDRTKWIPEYLLLGRKTGLSVHRRMR